ncbi:2-succinyl-6-hydroxy-2,4-cyclohexadiene-1-carboxylate synthase [Nostoc sp. 'Peltigera membranacea cyanobiont' 213]|uniref:2-succinyl-6-hydroxy-2, 4-cyclohexadiene-1-carboxylate synthase n=1 Tax=Nostoc cyanobionts TaxID=3123326 RepID=UPI000B958B54|nr:MULTISPECIES: 2-succinyl-6-hydroxy-2,4-cyclohexadiene-1-carboxylate synthase [unclassified Nostoc]AVH66846.1 2-succinyl-6-hydroxy-2,4-cyclohexadiene-1-carboxylate synthase [Nostoc sp. 'Peltigera membranacea cyanobiont' N6]OYD94141.1 2-succinyl-6-hydroxy-2,4-cyclohexadiene-1-carboxylate synthase [Nostoc sp. 'Peltigera membranacea cyanobiont' 213]
MTLKKYKLNYCLNVNTNKPLIVFLHGFMGNINEFDEAIKFLAEDFSYLILDLPGHGKTEVLRGDEYYKMEPIAQAIINLLDELKIGKCHLIGYSMGGRLALYLTLYFPERFIKVALESASPGLATGAERLERVRRDAQIARKISRSIIQTDFAAFLSNWYNQPIFGYIKNHPEYDRMIENRLQNNPQELDKSLRFMGTGCQPSLWEKLRDNKIHILLLAGEYDEKFIYINTEMAKIYEFAQLRIIRNAGHNIHFENTLAFVENIKSFLSAAS